MFCSISPLLLQQIATVLLIHFGQVLGMSKRKDFNLITAKKLLPVSIFYNANVGFALASLKGVNIPMYIAIKRITPLAVLVSGCIRAGPALGLGGRGDRLGLTAGGRGAGSNMYYTTSIHMSIGPTATGCRSLGSAYGKELKRRVIHPLSRRFASQTSCSCLFLAAAARPPGVRPTVRRRWCLVVR